MSNEDPFFPSRKKGTARTVIRPKPGGRSDSERPQPEGRPAPESGSAHAGAGPRLDELTSGPGVNGLEAAASHVVNAAVGLRHTTAQPDLTECRERVTRLLKQFRDSAERLGYSAEAIERAHYALCAFVDEIVLSTPWGGQSRWQEHSLLSTFHRQTWGGEEFFNIVDRAQTDPGRNRDLLELLYLLLALGFQGRYAAASDGRERLEGVRDSLFQSIRNQRPELERDLSLRWQGTNAGKPGLTGLVPLWVFAAVGAGILLLTYLVFSFSLNRASDPLFARVHSLDAEVLARLEVGRAEPSDAVQSALATLRSLLADDIAAERLALESDGRGVVIRVAGDGLFPSGSDRVNATYRPVVERIADALVQVPGGVLVSGHSDNVPIFSARFPSNWHLSEARAESVVEILREAAGYPDRYRYEGRADTQPIASNDSASGRARNRRVDIEVTPLSAGETGS